MNKGIVSYFGQQGGKMQLTDPYEIDLNSSGRSFQEQAALQLQSKYELKYRKEGYRYEGDYEIQEKGPMLANDWRKCQNLLLFISLLLYSQN